MKPWLNMKNSLNCLPKNNLIDILLEQNLLKWKRYSNLLMLELEPNLNSNFVKPMKHWLMTR